MKTIEGARARLRGLAREQEDRYDPDADRPIGGYVLVMGVYAGIVGALAATARVTEREVPDGLPLADIGLSALATHKLSRLLARDPVTSPLRVPFTAYRGTAGPAELDEEARGNGARKAVGEMVTCPFCADMWVATAFTAGLVFLPKTTRLAIGTFATLAGADLLQFGYAWLEKQAS